MKGKTASFWLGSVCCAVWIAGCGGYQETELASATQELAGDCSISLTCWDGSTVSCNGTNYQCSLVTNGVSCNGVTYPCPVQPDPVGASCYFNGVWYEDGYVYGRGRTPPYVYCSSKVNGVCMNGPLAGTGCVASGDCYATCDNGTWVNY